MTLKIFNDLKEKSFQNRFDTPKKRIDNLRKIQKWIKSNSDKIYAALNADFKKPQFETEVSEILCTFVSAIGIRRRIRTQRAPSCEIGGWAYR